MTVAHGRSTTRTPAGPASMTACASPMNRPCSTTPGMADKPVGQRFRIGNPLERGIEYPVAAVRDESVAVLAPPQHAPARRSRRRRRPPRPRAASRQARTARPRSAAESGRAPAPICSRRRSRPCAPEAAATIFSRSSAPPPPLIRRQIRARSRRRRRRSGRARASRRAWSAARRAARRRARVASEVGTPTTSRPARTRSASSSTKCLRGRAGAEAEPHAGPHPFDRARGGCTFLRFDVHCIGRPVRREVFSMDGALSNAASAASLAHCLNSALARSTGNR